MRSSHIRSNWMWELRQATVVRRAVPTLNRTAATLAADLAGAGQHQ